MELIAITLEKRAAGEEKVINRLFKEGLSTLHLRKPSSSVQEVMELLQQIHLDFHPRIVLHDHFQLLDSSHLKGVHLNGRNPEAPDREDISISRSCHSFDELQASSSLQYRFLSPIFDSISKAGYHRAFTHEQLIEAYKQGILNEKVYALGGIDETTISRVKQYGFGGVVVLGALWGNYEKDNNKQGVLERFHLLRNKCNQE